MEMSTFSASPLTVLGPVGQHVPLFQWVTSFLIRLLWVTSLVTHPLHGQQAHG